MLPTVPLPTATVAVADTKVEVRGLSRSEAVRLQNFEGDYDAAEDFVISCGVGIELDEAKAWRAATPPADVGLLVDKIVELSALDGELGKE